MAKRLGARRPGARQGSNPARVAAMQQRLRSGAYGTHQQNEDRTRTEREREALEDQDLDPREDDNA